MEMGVLKSCLREEGSNAGKLKTKISFTYIKIIIKKDFMNFKVQAVM